MKKTMHFQKMKILLLFLLMTSIMGTQLVAQQHKVTGTITDSNNGETLPRATVLVKGTAIKTATDNDGKYSVNLPDSKGILVFSYMGYITQSIDVANIATLDVKLVLDTKAVDEVVIVGYGSMKRSNLTGAVGSVNSQVINKTFATDPTSALQGRLSGVTVQSNGGEPGAGASISIRGVSSFTNTNPLIVINGIVGGSLSDLSSNDIQSVEILKDASSCAIYGASGGNGVILITTKGGGNSNKIGGSISMKSGVNWEKMLDVLNADEYSQYVTERVSLESNGLLLPPDWVKQAKGTKGTDWQGEVFKPGFVQEYNASIYGKQDDVSFRIGLSDIGEQGSLKGISSNKINFYGRMDIVKKKWKAGADFSVLHQDRTTNLWGQGGQTKVSKYAMFSIAMQNPIFTVDGTLPGSNQKWYDQLSANDYAYAQVPPSFFIDNFKGYTKYNKLDSRSYFELSPIRDLTIRAQLLFGFDSYDGSNFAPSFSFGEGIGLWSYNKNQVWEYANQSTYWNTDLYATYTKSWEKHNFKIMAGLNGGLTQRVNRNMTGTETPSNLIQVITAATSGLSITGDRSETSKAAYFGRFNYDYASKYLLQFTYRRDGTSQFGPGLKWGGFPSASVGWRISEEPFFSSVRSIVSNFKLRGGYGRSGNSNIGDYRYSNYVWPVINYTIGTDQTKWTGTNVRDFANKDAQWETSNQYDVGADLDFFDGKFVLEYNYFDKYTTDLLVQLDLPGESGGGQDQDGRVYHSPYMNFGKVRNWGHEATLTFKKMNGEFHFDVNLNVSFIRNKVLNMGYEGQKIFGGGMGGATEFQTSVIMAGETVASFYLIPTDGLFNNQAEIDNYTAIDPKTGIKVLIQPNAKPGDVKYVDTNKDGQITTNDRIISGDAFPDLSAGLGFNAAYKNFDFSILFTTLQGIQVMNGTLAKMTPNIGTGYGNVLKDYWDNHWSPQHPERNDARWPINLNETNNINQRPSDRYMDDGSYVRLKNVQLGYSIPKILLNRIGFEKARIYISGQNLITWTKYIGYDPEVGGGFLFGRGIDSGGTPLSRTFIAGIELSF